MRAVLQRVSGASVAVGGHIVGRIQHGLVVLVGVAAGDGPADIDYIASKVCEVRIFGDEHGRMNRSEWKVLVVTVPGSQFQVPDWTVF